LYSEIGLVLPNQRCFGLGQRNGRFQLEQGTYTFNARARDDGLPKDDGLGGKGGNHIHPFIMCQTNKTKEFFGMFFVSTGPQVFEIVKFTNSSRMVLNYITIGGVLEFYVIMLGNAQDIISRYHAMVGMPVMPAYYSLGIFHGSNSYDSWSAINTVYNNYNGSATGEKQALEGVFVETFNQKPHWTFTVNTDKFPNIGDEVDKIHGRNQRIIFGASTALNPDNAYPWFVQANSAKCLIRSIPLITNGPLQGILDRVPVTYLDSYSGCFESFMSSILPSFS
jgi:alpha-glucosidase (family GH31 glycosyl hydrolase)